MQISGIRSGDLVLADVRGERFYAEVQGRTDRRELEVETLSQRRYRILTSRQVARHWRLAGRRNGSSS